MNPADSMAGVPMRGVFESGDAWRSTGDLFLRDDHGDLWLAGPVAEVVDTADGPAIPSGARFALGTIPAVDLVVAYGVADGDEEVLVGARDAARGRRRRHRRPRQGAGQAAARCSARATSRWSPSIPMTTWHRPQWRPLQAKGVPTPSRTRRVWRLDPDRAHYEPLA